MANRYFAGNSLASFSRTATAIVEVTTAGRFDSAYVSSAITFSGSPPDYLQTPTFTATGTIWTHYEFYYGSNLASTWTWFKFVNGATDVFQLVMSGSNLQPQYWNGSAWVNTGTSISFSATSSRLVVDLKVVLNSGFELYLGGTLVASGSGWSGGGTTVTAAQIKSASNGGASNAISQVMIADYDLRSSKYMAAALNGNSASNTGGTGAYTDINETVLDESTSEKVTTSTNKMGQTHAAITVPSGYIIAAMAIGARGRVTGTITDGKLGIRSGGSNYSSTGRTYNAGYEPRVYISDTDPNTATQFTQTGFNNAETYIEAV